MLKHLRNMCVILYLCYLCKMFRHNYNNNIFSFKWRYWAGFSRSPQWGFGTQCSILKTACFSLVYI